MKEARRPLGALALGLVAYGWVVVAPTPLPAWARDVVLVPAVGLLAAALLRRLVTARPDERTWLRPLALGVAAFPVGRLVDAAGDTAGVASVGPLADTFALLGSCLVLSGLFLALRRRLSGLRLNVALDGLAGALAGTALAGLAVAPLVHQVWDGSWAAALLLARPLLDALLVSAAAGAVGLLGAGHAHQFGTWTLGLVLLATSDIAAATAAANGHTPASTATAGWIDMLAVAAVALLAVGAVFPVPDEVVAVPGAKSLTVPALALLTGVAVLTVAPPWDVAAVPTVLALLTLLVCTLRFVRVFRQLRELAAMREQALTDELTGIANRRALYQLVDGLLTPAEDGGELPEFTVGLIDLDHFKEVNDTLGHHIGDALLKGVTKRFAAALEELETPHLLARLGGDEFAFVLHEATTRNAALIVGEALQESLAAPFELDGAVLHAQASIGLAVAPHHGPTRGEILFAADAAMYAAKTGGESVHFHAPAGDEKTQQLGIAEDLYRALESDELVVEYQPIRNLQRDLVAVEALVRWDHPERGRLEPEEFLDVADRYRLTGAIAQRVLGLALRDLARWRSVGIPLTVSVNIAPADLRDENVVHTVASALLEHELPAQALTLDISERGLMADLERIRGVITALDDLGVRLALDDYGSAGTSLEALTTLPFDQIKLDRRYGRDAAVSAEASGLVRATIDLTHALRRVAVAEGVEDQRAHDALAAMGCDLVQGFHVGRPVPLMELETLLLSPNGGKHRGVPHQPTPEDPRPTPHPQLPVTGVGTEPIGTGPMGTGPMGTGPMGTGQPPA